jgi:hypothetical protein
MLRIMLPAPHACAARVEAVMALAHPASRVQR